MNCRTRRRFSTRICDRCCDMIPDHVTGADIPQRGTPGGSPPTLPSSFPPWAKQLAELYFSGTTSAFVLHGNTYDYVRSPRGEKDEYVGLAEFLSEQRVGRWLPGVHYAP